MGVRLSALANLALRRPRTVVGVWVVLLVAGGALSSQLEKRLQNGGYTVDGSASVRAGELNDELFPSGADPQAYVSVIGAKTSPGAVRRAARQATRAVRRVSSVDEIGRPARSADRRAIGIPLTFDGDIGAAQTHVPSVESALEGVDVPRVRVELIGEAAVYHQLSVQARESLQVSWLISFPATLIILLIAFLSVVAAFVPLWVATMALATTFGALYLLSFVIPMNVFVEDTALVLGLGLSIDYSLFMITRVREGLAESGDMGEAVRAAMSTTGRTIALSGITIAAALAGMYVIGVGAFSSLATGAIGATVVAVAASLTFMPAVLVLLGDRLERFPVRRAVAAANKGSLWRRLADFVVRRRLLVVAVVVPVMVVMSLPLTGLEIKVGSTSTLPEGDPVREAVDRNAAAFGTGFQTPVIVLGEAQPRRLGAFLARQPGVAGVGPATFSEVDRGTVRFFVSLDDEGDTPEAADSVRELRTSLAARFGDRVEVGGQTAEAVDLIDRLEARTPLVVLFVLLVEFLVLTLAFGAPLVALKAALTTLLSVTAALGLTILLFPSAGGIEFFVPLFLFATVFGLSTDYEVFLLSRARAFYRSGMSNDESIKEAMVRTSRSITLAGITMSIVFFALAVSPLVSFQQFGVGLGLAVLIDVTLVRGLLVPATVALLGDANWWRPGRRK